MLTSSAGIEVRRLSAGYGAEPICRDVTLTIPAGAFTAIIGPNGCGKSTLLRVLAGLLRPTAGQVLLGGCDIAAIPARTLARRVGLLPQSAEAPSGITVGDLVARGRFPWQGLFRQWSPDDAKAVAEAMDQTGTRDLAREQVGHLSGGQRQRVWVAMALAQQTPLLLLDEPTTYMDIAHQFDLLDLFAGLNDRGRTIIAVLHDLGQAARYASQIVMMKDGRIVTEGDPHAVMTEARMAEVFGLDCLIGRDPLTGTPMVIPRSRRGARSLRPDIAESITMD